MTFSRKGLFSTSFLYNQVHLCKFFQQLSYIIWLTVLNYTFFFIFVRLKKHNVVNLSMSFTFDDWYKDACGDDAIIAYSGDISSEVITNTLDSAEEVLLKVTDDLKVIRRVYNVLIESLQNLYHHSIHNVITGKDPHFAAFILKPHPDGYLFIGGNYVESSRVKILRDRIDQINSLSKEELKSLYKMILNNLEFSEKGGGGLGMIDISKRTGGKLDYNFYTVNDKYSFYQLNILIS